MMQRPLPAAFSHLIDERNPAVDAVLAEALPDMEPFSQAVAMELLAKRGSAESLSQLVRGFRQYRGVLRDLILAHAESLAPGLRAAIPSSSVTERLTAIDLIVQSGSAQLCYILADALRSGCRRTRESSASGLKSLTQRWHDTRPALSSLKELADFAKRANHLVEAISLALQRWELHHQPAVLEAALLMEDRAESALREKMSAPHTKLDHALGRLLEEVTEPCFVGSVIRAMAVESLRPSAVRMITEIHDAALWNALFAGSWLLTDPAVRKGFRHLQVGPWLDRALSVVVDLPEAQAEDALRFLCALGGTPERKMEWLRPLAESGSERIRYALTWRLIDEDHEASTNLLRVLTLRAGDPSAVIAQREIRRRTYRHGGFIDHREVTQPSAGGSTEDEVEAFEDRIPSAGPARRDSRDAFRSARGEQLVRELQQKIQSDEPLDRIRALNLIAERGMTGTMASRVHRMAGDADAMVRAAAVKLLAQIPGPTTERLLRSAAADPDPRTQANALEAMESLGLDDRAIYTRPQLQNRSNRVRANAVKSLLRMESAEAAAALIEMLSDESAAHRLSALFVIERLPSRAVLDLVLKLADHDPNARVRNRASRVAHQLVRDTSGMSGPRADEVTIPSGPPSDGGRS